MEQLLTTTKNLLGGQASPNPTYPQDINVVTGQQEVLVRGKNLFDGILELGLINGNTGLDQPNSTIIRDKNYIQVEGNTQYVISTPNSTIASDSVLIYEYKADYSYNLTTNIDVAFGTSWTTKADTKYIRFRPRYATTDTTIKFMVEKGTTASEWQPYQEQTNIVNLSSKNLIGLSNGTYSNNGITAVVENGTITLNGTASGTSFVSIPLVQEITLSNSAITLSTNNEATGGDNLTEIRVYTSGSSYLACSYNTINNSVTYTNKADTYLRLQIRTSSGISYSDFILKPQLEYNSSATTYEPYYNYELCKIGTYQDRIYKNNDKWYIEKNIGKAILNGSETITSAQTAVSRHNRYLININNIKQPSSATEMPNVLSNRYIAQIMGTAGSWGAHQGISINNSSSQLVINDDTYYSSDTSAYKTWLSSNNVEVLFAYATPTYTEITNETLLNELNELEKIMSYSGQTNISVSGNLPMILDVSALKGE